MFIFNLGYNQIDSLEEKNQINELHNLLCVERDKQMKRLLCAAQCECFPCDSTFTRIIRTHSQPVEKTRVIACDIWIKN